jgi:hypothetical protein
VREDLELHAGCIAGAAQIDELKLILQNAGFTGISIKAKDEGRELTGEWSPDRNLGDFVFSASIEATKP